MRRQSWQRRITALAAGAMTVFGLACAPPASQAGSASASASSSDGRGREQKLDHVIPARDSIGRSPTRFSWTKIDAADSYSIGVWNEVDVMVWRQNNIPATSVDVPADVQFEPGTYLWSVSALREGEEIASSGLAAFVVRTVP